jgi:NAD(P)-dependent dehydrogenase (short-subunit alcohol dehydrogenase family)
MVGRDACGHCRHASSATTHSPTAMSLAEDVAIVTGGGDGIGGATARRLAEEGASVLIVEISEQLGEENAAAIRAAGGVAEGVVLDVSSSADIKLMVDTAVEKFGRLTILVNNAYGSRRDLPTPSQSELGDTPGARLPNSSKGSALDLTEEGWDYAFDIGLKSHFLAAKHAVPHMAQAGGGAIVNISSVHGILSARNNLAYSSLKAGVLGLTRQMAVDFGPLGVRVNAILPGLIVKESAAMSPTREPSSPEQAERRAFMADQYPVRHYGEPLDIANGVRFLCSDEASFITGHALNIDGGLTIQLQEDMGMRQAEFKEQQIKARI